MGNSATIFVEIIDTGETEDHPRYPAPAHIYKLGKSVILSPPVTMQRVPGVPYYKPALLDMPGYVYHVDVYTDGEREFAPVKLRL